MIPFVSTGKTEKRNKHPRQALLWKTMLLCLVPALAVFGFWTIRYGAFTLRDDFNRESLPFQPAMQRGLWNLLAGKGEWTWNLDLGTPFVYGFGFYNLGSPFFLLTLPFAGISYPVYAGAALALKYAVAGGLSALYVRRMLSDKPCAERLAMLGGVLYAFSGYMTLNMMYQFADSVALFPLLLLAAECKLRAGKQDGFARRHGFFIFAVALNAFTSYFFFVEEVLFLFLYFVFRMSDPEVRAQDGNCAAGTAISPDPVTPPESARRNAVQDSAIPFRVFLSFLADGALGAGIAAVLLIPSYTYVLGNGRSSAAMLHARFLFSGWKEVLFLLRSMLLPADTMPDESAVVAFDYSSGSLYLPLCGLCLAAAYFIRRSPSPEGRGRIRTSFHADWLGKLILLLMLVSFSPLLSSAFCAFAADYKRWWFMLILLLAAASCRVLQEPDRYGIVPAAGICLAAALLVIVLCEVLPGDGGQSLVRDQRRFLIYGATALAGDLVILLFGAGASDPARVPAGAKQKRKQHEASAKQKKLRQQRYCRCGSPEAVLAALTVLIASGTTFFQAFLYHTEDTGEYLRNYRAGEELVLPDDQYRFRLDTNELLLPGEASGIGAFSSTVSNSIKEFDQIFNYYQGTVSFDKKQYPGLAELFGAKYYLNVEDGGSRVSEGKAAPIGFSPHACITLHDLKYYVKPEDMGTVLLYAAAVEEKDLGDVSDVLPQIQGPEVDRSASQAYIDMDLADSVSDFERSASGFTCTTSWGEDRYVYFSVPNEKGWQCVIDQTPVPILDSNGMMLIRVPAGAHRITFTYRTPGLRAGAALSLLCLILCLLSYAAGHAAGSRAPRPEQP